MAVARVALDLVGITLAENLHFELLGKNRVPGEIEAVKFPSSEVSR